MVTITASDISKATNGTVQQLGYSFVKEDQRRVVAGIVGGGTDVFAVLPTGCKNSLCYACLPMVFDQLEAESRLAEVQQLCSSSQH